MVWIPGVDEIPLSVSGVYSGGLVSVTVAKVGEATEALHELKTGNYIGVRGPFGNHFAVSIGNTLVIGGGTGIAPLAFLAEKLAEHSSRITFIAGAKTADELLFLDRVKSALSKLNSRIIVLTEDGSFGLKGVVTDPLSELLEKERFNMIYVCGPEPMIRKAFLAAEKVKVPLQASLERVMRCGIGICGSCVIGKYRVCRDGPVFSSQQLREVLDELGVFKRDINGKKIFYS
jgi:dihydroorotate dehydrogenase electron transfer subunit